MFAYCYEFFFIWNTLNKLCSKFEADITKKSFQQHFAGTFPLGYLFPFVSTFLCVCKTSAKPNFTKFCTILMKLKERKKQNGENVQNLQRNSPR